MYRSFSSLPDVPQHFVSFCTYDLVHALQKQDLISSERRTLLLQVSHSSGSLHRLSLDQRRHLPQLLSGKQIPFYPLHGDPSPTSTIQSIILIDLFYLAGIKLVAHYDQGESSYACLLIFLTLLC